MRKMIVGLLAVSLTATTAFAALPQGAAAPDFKTMGAIGGKPFRLHLQEQLKSGPVVLYFYPKAFTKGCTLEAKAFADAMPEFRKAGARVIGMSADDIETLKRFSVETCRSAFPVAIASRETIKAYDVGMPIANTVSTMSNRTSYVIDRKGRVVMVHSEMDWKDHVAKTLAAVQALKAKGG